MSSPPENDRAPELAGSKGADSGTVGTGGAARTVAHVVDERKAVRP